MNYSFDHLQAFVATVENGSFKEAGIKLGKHRTTVGDQVANLEIETGLTLFNREVRKLSLTDDGEALYRVAKPIIATMSRFATKVDSLSRGIPKELFIAIDHTIRTPALFHCCKTVQEQYPDVEVRILSGNPLQVLQWLENHEADIGILLSVFQDDGEFATRQLFNFDLICVAPIDEDIPSEGVNEDQIRNMTQIVDSWALHNEDFTPHCRSDRVIQANSIDDILEMVSAGFGWAAVPDFKAKPFIEAGRIKAFTETYQAPYRWSAEMIIQDESSISEPLQLLMDELIKLPNLDRF